MKSQKGILAVVFFVVALFFWGHSARAALPAYVEIVGTTQGDILGS